MFHLVPSGILQPGTVNLIGPGVVVDPRVLLRELGELEAKGVLRDPARIRVSGRAHVILDWHIALDKARDEARAEGAIGTTGRGIGPAYEDKVARRGIRVADLLDPAALRRAVRPPGEGEELRADAAPPLGADRPRGALRGVRRARPAPRALRGPHRPHPRAGAARRQERAVRGRPGLAPRHRPRHLPVRHVVELRGRGGVHRGRRRADADRRRPRHHQGLHDAGRRRPLPERGHRTEAASGSASAASSSAPPPDASAAAAGSTSWCCATRRS